MVIYFFFHPSHKIEILCHWYLKSFFSYYRIFICTLDLRNESFFCDNRWYSKIMTYFIYIMLKHRVYAVWFLISKSFIAGLSCIDIDFTMFVHFPYCFIILINAEQSLFTNNLICKISFMIKDNVWWTCIKAFCIWKFAIGFMTTI